MENKKEEIVLSRKKTIGNASYPYHCHSGCEIYFFLSGNIRVYIEDKCFLPPPDSLIIFKPNQLHRIQSIDESMYERIVIDLSEDYMNNIGEGKQWLFDCFLKKETSNLATLDFSKREEILSLCNMIGKNSYSKKPADEVRKKAYMEILLATVNEIYSTRRQHFQDAMPDLVVKIMMYVDHHLTETISFAQMAEEFGLPLVVLREEFKKHIGLTLREYLLERKLVNAKVMLNRGASVTEACYSSGFNDYANFIRSFKKKEGVSPGKYRK